MSMSCQQRYQNLRNLLQAAGGQEELVTLHSIDYETDYIRLSVKICH